jgi:hypothetical protein
MWCPLYRQLPLQHHFWRVSTYSLTNVIPPQVIKYSMDGEQLLVLGLRGKPGHDTKRFCKPTAVRLYSKWTACSQYYSIHA